MSFLIENRKERTSFGGVWPTTEKNRVRHYYCLNNDEYRVRLNRTYITNDRWKYSCVVERNIGNVIEGFILHIGGNPFWGENKPWEYAEGQIGHYVKQYLEKKEQPPKEHESVL